MNIFAILVFICNIDSHCLLKFVELGKTCCIVIIHLCYHVCNLQKDAMHKEIGTVIIIKANIGVKNRWKINKT